MMVMGEIRNVGYFEAAYVICWLIVVGYLLYLNGRLSRLENRMTQDRGADGRGAGRSDGE